MSQRHSRYARFSDLSRRATARDAHSSVWTGGVAPADFTGAATLEDGAAFGFALGATGCAAGAALVVASRTAVLAWPARADRRRPQEWAIEGPDV